MGSPGYATAVIRWPGTRCRRSRLAWPGAEPPGPDDESIGDGHDAAVSRSGVPGPLDLPSHATPRPKRRWWAIAVIIGIVAALGFVATKALNDASVFFYNVDEAVARHDELGDSRFRVQGTVRDGVEDTGDGVVFVATFNGAEIEVVHQGDPPELFRPGMPVVVEGRWDPAGADASGRYLFSSDRMLIKHDDEYEAEHSDRIDEADQGGKTPATSVSEGQPTP